MADPAGLQARTRAILDALEYRGPFELEYLLDRRTGGYKVIELNPRHWYQYRLAAALSRENMIRRYLGWELMPNPPTGGKGLWLETIPAIKPLATFRIPGLWRRLPGAVWAYPPSGALRYTIRCKLDARRRAKRRQT
ncbi:MAG: hypothetical protein M1457_08290 [bacterium]|nr:hypothetical protein [bacterium]